MEKRSREGGKIPPESSRIHEIVMMHFGLAIENLCKGIMIARLGPARRSSIRSEGRLPGEIKTHQLLRLAKGAGLSIESAAEEAMLLRLQRATEWAGRYPVATSPKGSKDRVLIEAEDWGPATLTFIGKSDFSDARKIVRRLLAAAGLARD